MKNIDTISQQKIVRYQDKCGKIHYGILNGDTILQLTNTFLELVNNVVTYDGTSLPLKDAKILIPVDPSKIVNFGWTFVDHAKETGGESHLREPFLFLKPQSSLIADQETIILPPPELTRQVELEGEVAAIIGRRCKNVSEEDALAYVFGYTVFNDVTARDLTHTDPQFTRGKGFDSFGPVGPYISTGIDPGNLKITTTLNGNIVQHGSTSQMSFRIPFLISWISHVMTLEPGDILALGSPAGTCPMKAGDVVTVTVDQIGSLTNYVA